MKKFNVSFFITLINVFNILSVSHVEASISEPQEKKWVILYHMAYDNNLSTVGPVILKTLENSVSRLPTNASIAVSVLIDFPKSDSLIKATFLPGQDPIYESMKNVDDNSASKANLVTFINSVRKELPSKHYALVFLDHGGRLDEMSYDQSPAGIDSKPAWLSAKDVGPILASIRKELNTVKRNLDLVFLQQCGRGSINNLYNFRNSADVVMASEYNVGAPNTYYDQMIIKLNENLEQTTALDLAKIIANNDSHFTNYTVVSGKELSNLPAKLTRLANSISDNVTKEISLANVKPVFKTYAGDSIQDGFETNYDLREWLMVVKKFNPSVELQQEISIFLNWAESNLKLAYRVHPKLVNEVGNKIGLSLFIPSNEALSKKYSKYPLFEASKELGKVLETIRLLEGQVGMAH